MSDFLTKISKLSPQRLALLAAELNDRLEALEEDRSGPVAIVGMGCRAPGGVHDAESLWKLLSEGVDAIEEVPADRWNIDDFYDRNPDTPGKMATRCGGFIKEADRFDPKFFGIAPAEATPMDPQQRLLLESTWEALEDAGIPPLSLAGSLTGVFVGICNSDYGNLAIGASHETITPYFASGLSHAVAAGRISYVLGLEGPSLAVDTSCSASLMGVHLACQSLRRKESDLALAGGVNLILNPEVSIALSQSHMMAPDGRCKAFSDSADGFVRSEGVGMIVLKRLRDAVQDGSRILAVIRGTAANQDGRSSGLTAPNGRSQEAVVRAALADAGMSADDLQYIEAHGTGTALGDPIEIGALEKVFAERPLAAERVRIGSIKSNLGHLESAAGIVGLMKLVLSLQHKEIPATLHCEKANHRIDWDRIPIRLSKEKESWPVGLGKRAGGVSSFGFSGTNVHIIVEEDVEEGDPVDAAKGDGTNSERPLLFPISAKSQTGLQSIATRLSSYLGDHPDLPFAGISRTLTTGRSHFDHRFAVPATSREELLEALRGFDLARGRNSEAGRAGRSPRVCFVFADHQFARANMGRDLYEAVPKFREVINRCEDMLLDAIGHPLSSLMYPDSIERPADIAPEIVPVASFAVQYALAELWRSCGLEPALTLGIGTGECIAACFAGVIRLEDALHLTLTLERDSLQDAEEFARRIDYSAARLPWLTAETNQNEKSALWLRRAKAAAASKSFTELVNEKCTGYVTMAESTAFRQLAAMAGEDVSGKSFGSFYGQLSALQAFMRNAAGLYILGCNFDFSGFYGKTRVRTVSLPTYPFERERYWLDVERRIPLEQPVAKQTISVSSADQAEHADNWLYELTWEPRPLPQNPAGSGETFSTLIEEVVSPEPNDVVLRVTDAGERIQPICTGYVLKTLQRLGLKPATDREFTVDDLCSELKIAPGRARIVRRMLRILVEDGILEQAGESLRFTEFTGRADPDTEIVALGNACPEIQTELAVLKRCTDHTPAVLLGTRDPMQLVFAEGSVQEAEQIYENSPICRYFNTAVRDVVVRAVGQITNRTIRILEIGAGTGATTSSVLPAIAHKNVEYTFTDVSPVFLAKAREKFKDASRVSYKLLNIERSPVEQGFEAGQYDIVLAANVLHATADLRQTIAHTRQLLRPGGMLMLVEGVRSDRWLELTFGLTDGWWRFTDRALRPEHPLLPGEKWEQILREHGMSFTRTIRYEAKNGRQSQQVLMLASVDITEAALQPESGSRRWLLFSDEISVGSALGQRLQDRGENVELVYRSSSSEAESALQALRSRWPDDAFEIVYLWGMDVVESTDSDRGIQICTQIPIQLMQALSQPAMGESKLWLVTRGAQAAHVSTPPSATGALQSMMWGVGRVFGLENPARYRRLIDLDPNGTPADIAADLFGELLHEDSEDQVAHRQGQRFVPRLIHQDDAILGRAPQRLRSDSSYLIIGGLGTVGRRVTKWAAEAGAGHLVFLSETELTPDSDQSGNERAAFVEEIRASGTPVTVVVGDASSESTIRKVFGLFGRECPDLRGVFHVGLAQSTAEFAADRAEQDADLLRRILGTRMLHEWTKDRNLDFFIAFSSSVSLLGSQGMPRYAAATQFLDNFAHFRRAQGLPMLSVDWGPWREGEGTPPAAISRFRQAGLLPMEPTRALRWMSQLTCSSRATIMIADVDWKTLKAIHESRRVRPMLVDLGSTVTTEETSNSSPEIPARTPEERREFIEQSVISESAKVLGFRAGEAPPVDIPLTDLGLDSLMAVDLRNRLHTALGRKLPPTIVFEYPTIAELVGVLETMLWTADVGSDHDSLALREEIQI
jgi:acyl transferase domain-containing protein/SAM-dependent methyltransferase/acyl carrier protein